MHKKLIDDKVIIDKNEKKNEKVPQSYIISSHNILNERENEIKPDDISESYLINSSYNSLTPKQKRLRKNLKEKKYI